jgi:hypothetical protein
MNQFGQHFDYYTNDSLKEYDERNNEQNDKKRKSFVSRHPFLTAGAISIILSSIAYACFKVIPIINHVRRHRSRASGKQHQQQSSSSGSLYIRENELHPHPNMTFERMVISQSYLPGGAHALPPSSLNGSWFKPGDLIFTQLNPFLDQMLMTWLEHPIGMLKTNAVSLIVPSGVPSHVAVVVEVRGCRMEDVFILESRQSPFSSSIIRSLRNFMSVESRPNWTVSVGTLSHSIDPNVLKRVLESVRVVNPSYSDKIVWNYDLKRNHGSVCKMTLNNDTGTVGSPDSIAHLPIIVPVNSNNIQHGASLTPIDSNYNPLIGNHDDSKDRLPWSGIYSKEHNCSTLTNALFEAAGLTIPFTSYTLNPHAPAIKCPPPSSEETNALACVADFPSSHSSQSQLDILTMMDPNALKRLIIHPLSILPHDFLRRDFQWSPSVGLICVRTLSQFFK